VSVIILEQEKLSLDALGSGRQLQFEEACPSTAPLVPVRPKRLSRLSQRAVESTIEYVQTKIFAVSAQSLTIAVSAAGYCRQEIPGDGFCLYSCLLYYCARFVREGPVNCLGLMKLLLSLFEAGPHMGVLTTVQRCHMGLRGEKRWLRLQSIRAALEKGASNFLALDAWGDIDMIIAFAKLFNVYSRQVVLL